MGFLKNAIAKIRWFFWEMLLIYSSKPSFFSKKRIESGIAFVVAQWGMILFLVKKIDAMTISDILIWAGAEFAVAGYMINQIQKEKTSTEEPPAPLTSDDMNNQSI